jgi:hypothetical protein
MERSILSRLVIRVLLLITLILAVTLAGCAAPPVAPSIPTPIPTPNSGKCNVWGQVMWNDQPVAGAEVEMGTGFIGVESVTPELIRYYPGETELCAPVYKTITDSEGYYLFSNVAPGEYVRKVRAFGEEHYPEGYPHYDTFRISAGETEYLGTFQFAKHDLKLNTPADGATVAYDKLVLTWEVYPGAHDYEVLLSPPDEASPESVGRTTETSYIYTQPLLNGQCTWYIIAYNQNGHSIAYSDFHKFTITGAARSVHVEKVSPLNEAGVSSTGLTLQWKPYPGASYYMVHVGDIIAEAQVNMNIKVTSTSYTIPEVLKPGRYCWKVAAYDSSNNILADSWSSDFIVK